MKKLTLTESELTNLIQKAVEKKLMEQQNERYMFFSNLEQISRQAKMLLEMDDNMVEEILDGGHDWAQDHIAEAKNNVDQVFDFLMNETKNEDGEMEVDVNMTEQYNDDFDFEEWEDEDDPNTVATFPVDDPNFDLSDSDMADIYTYKGPKRRGRGSIYIDLMVPETDDVEYDRKVAKEMLRYLSKKLKVENYVGGFGFKRGLDFDAEF
jgi:hypothetical protein